MVVSRLCRSNVQVIRIKWKEVPVLQVAHSPRFSPSLKRLVVPPHNLARQFTSMKRLMIDWKGLGVGSPCLHRLPAPGGLELVAGSVPVAKLRLKLWLYVRY